MLYRLFVYISSIMQPPFVYLFICVIVYLSIASNLVPRIRATRRSVSNAYKTASGSY